MVYFLFEHYLDILIILIHNAISELDEDVYGSMSQLVFCRVFVLITSDN